MAREVEIVGGGLAGLSLGIALAERGVPVRLWEAGELPRHRVCGEFICGVRQNTLDKLGISEEMEMARLHSEGRWSDPDGKVFYRCRLPRPALGLSRHFLDIRLVRRLERLGGQVEMGSRWRGNRGREGVVLAHGRSAKRTEWMGFKVHLRGEHFDGLSLFLGNGGYVGLSPVESGYWNLCGLFRKRQEVRAGKEEILGAYADHTGMGGVRQILDRSEIRPGSGAGVAGVSFEIKPFTEGQVRIGDAWGVIPPFTGNGMSMAFESAELSVKPLMDWSEGHCDWGTVSQRIERGHRKRFQKRMRIANWIHPWLIENSKRRILRRMAILRILPFRPLYALTH